MKNRLRTAAILLSIFFLSWSNSIAGQSDWETYRSEKYGFQMLSPKGTKFEEREFKGGLGGLYAKYGVVELFGLAQLGEEATLDEIEEIGEEITGIPGEFWKKIDEGTNENGWKVYRAYQAKQGNIVLYAGLGTGPKGSYLLLLKTTADDVAKYEASYKKWYDSLKVF
jgi:hypothetical protein